MDSPCWRDSSTKDDELTIPRANARSASWKFKPYTLLKGAKTRRGKPALGVYPQRRPPAWIGGITLRTSNKHQPIPLRDLCWQKLWQEGARWSSCWPYRFPCRSYRQQAFKSVVRLSRFRRFAQAAAAATAATAATAHGTLCYTV